MSVRTDRLEFEDGRSWTAEVVEHRESMTVVAVREDGCICLVRQYRRPADEWLLETPAGSVDPGESAEASVNRELAEETGHKAHSVRYLGSFFLAPGWCTEYMHAYLATDLYPASAEPDEDEVIDVVWMTRTDWEREIRENRVRDSKSIAAWFLALPHLPAAAGEPS